MQETRRQRLPVVPLRQNHIGVIYVRKEAAMTQQAGRLGDAESAARADHGPRSSGFQEAPRA